MEMDALDYTLCVLVAIAGGAIIVYLRRHPKIAMGIVMIFIGLLMSMHETFYRRQLSIIHNSEKFIECKGLKFLSKDPKIVNACLEIEHTLSLTRIHWFRSYVIDPIFDYVLGRWTQTWYIQISLFLIVLWLSNHYFAYLSRVDDYKLRSDDQKDRNRLLNYFIGSRPSRSSLVIEDVTDQEPLEEVDIDNLSGKLVD
jgi:hypothetical protein